jgi:hypothetical protein
MTGRPAHAVNRDLVSAMKAQAKRTGEQSPSVHGSDWRLATVTAVNTNGTVDADGIPAIRRMDTYQAPVVGDAIVISQSSSGNWRAEGRLSTGADTGWTTATLATGFAHDGNSNGNIQYRAAFVGGVRMMQWRGGLGVTYSGNSIQNGGNFLNTALGATLRPSSRRSLAVACSAATSSSLSLKVDFQTDGTVQIVGTTTNTSDTYSTPIIRPPWVSLNGLQYSLDA